MSSPEMRHPDEGLLLRYLDGELPRRKARSVRQHLEACWQCRAGLEELQKAIGNCVRYDNVLRRNLPPTPAPWQDLSAGFERVDASLVREPVLTRLQRALWRPAVRWLATGAGVLALAAVIAYQWRETPSVWAAGLLKQAVAVADSRPRPARRIRIRTRTRELTRLVGANRDSAESAALEYLFRSARYDWNDPLSARSYRAWHDGLADKRDDVVQSADAYRIHTTTSDGDLVAATLSLRITDLEPTAGRFEFRNQEWVELTELADQQTLPASTVAGATGGMSRQTGMPPESGKNTGAAPREAGIAEELRALAALHQVGADLGDPVEIRREGGHVLISGTGITPQRQRQIHEVLDPLANVVVRFADPDAAPAVAAEPAAAAGDTADANSQQIQTRLALALGGRSQVERFSSQALDWTDTALSRAYALRRLAQEFPAEVERQLSGADRTVLRNLGREHLAAMAKASGQLEGALVPVLASLGAAPARQAVSLESGPWQPGTEELLAASRRVEALVAVVLGMAPPENPAADAPSQLADALSQFTANLERCRRLLSYDDVRQSK